MKSLKEFFKYIDTLSFGSSYLQPRRAFAAQEDYTGPTPANSNRFIGLTQKRKDFNRCFASALAASSPGRNPWGFFAMILPETWRVHVDVNSIFSSPNTRSLWKRKRTDRYFEEALTSASFNSPQLLMMSIYLCLQLILCAQAFLVRKWRKHSGRGNWMQRTVTSYLRRSKLYIICRCRKSIM